MTVVNVPHHSHIVVPSVADYALGPQVVQSRVRAPGPAWERLLVYCHDRASIPHPRCPPTSFTASPCSLASREPRASPTSQLCCVSRDGRPRDKFRFCSKCPPVPDLTSPCPAASSARQGSSHLSAAAAYLSVGSISLPFSWGVGRFSLLPSYLRSVLPCDPLPTIYVCAHRATGSQEAGLQHHPSCKWQNWQDWLPEEAEEDVVIGLYPFELDRHFPPSSSSSSSSSTTTGGTDACRRHKRWAQRLSGESWCRDRQRVLRFAPWVPEKCIVSYGSLQRNARRGDKYAAPCWSRYVETVDLSLCQPSVTDSNKTCSSYNWFGQNRVPCYFV